MSDISHLDHLDEVLPDPGWMYAGASEEPLRLYISGPMSGIKDFNRPLFMRVREALRLRGHFVICPTELDDVPNGAPEVMTPLELEMLWKAFLIRDVAMILTCQLDAIVVLPGWWRSRGARLEILAGLSVGLRLLEWPLLTNLRLAHIKCEDLCPPEGDLYA
jgi:hypothetical protein